MRLKILLPLFIIVSLRCYAPNALSDPKINETRIKAEMYFREQQLKSFAFQLLRTYILIESNNNPLAYNKKENAVGILQIRPCMVQAINNLLLRDKINVKFTLDDRWNPVKSIEMWIIFMRHKNPTYDVRKSCILWNGAGKDGQGNYDYYMLITQKLKTMKLIKPSYQVLNPIKDIHYGYVLGWANEAIEEVARTCYKSEDKITTGSADELITKLINREHEAMLEFGPDITVKFICDRGVSHELVRHRLCSFAQESTRYCNYSKDKFDNQVTFIIPEWCNLPESEWKYVGFVLIGEVPKHEIDALTFVWVEQMAKSEKSYNALIAGGWQPQQARSVLPNSLKTEINVKANIREWRHIFAQRCSAAAHPQMRELMIPLRKEFNSYAPLLFPLV